LTCPAPRSSLAGAAGAEPMPLPGVKFLSVAEGDFGAHLACRSSYFRAERIRLAWCSKRCRAAFSRCFRSVKDVVGNNPVGV
jgi:hypothetical protein